MVAKIYKLAAVPAGLALTSYGLYAVSDREPKGKCLSPHQLSVYSVPPRQSKYIEEQPSRLQCVFAAVRKSVWPAVTWGKYACDSIKNGVEDTFQFGKDSYVYLKNPPPEFLPRVGIISVSGLAGLVLARKGSRLKKIMYPLGLTALGVSVCYPAQAVILAKVTGKKLYSTSHWTYDSIRSLWKEKPQPQKDYTSPTPAADHQEAVRVEGHSEVSAGETATEQIVMADTEPPVLPESAHLLDVHSAEQTPDSASAEPRQEVKFMPPADLADHGQSNPEDVDMYSTRT
ncbi:MICOS complex subunit MIC27 [Pseudophryne corroboree]|uniref:MICOS complex subunit MIC27 n=1 Tax=Pseudophryne corroboree TaxID=495146 RepID=UPI003081D0DE